MYQTRTPDSTRNNPGNDFMSLEVIDVTGSRTVHASDIQRSLPAGVVAESLADRLRLPANVPWALRDEETSAFLDDEQAIGDQVDTDALVTVTPKTHLG